MFSKLQSFFTSTLTKSNNVEVLDLSVANALTYVNALLKDKNYPLMIFDRVEILATGLFWLHLEIINTLARSDIPFMWFQSVVTLSSRCVTWDPPDGKCTPNDPMT